MSDFYETKIDCVIAAKREARSNERGYAYATQWSGNRWTVEPKKPFMRPTIFGKPAELIEVRADGQELLA